VDGPDEIVFLARDPAAGHVLSRAPEPGTLHLTGPLRAPLFRGQILQVMCFSGGQYWAYVTVGGYVAASEEDEVEVPLESGDGAKFPLQNDALSGDTCFTRAAPAGSTQLTIQEAAKVFRVDRFRYRIATFAPNGDEVDWGTDGARPYLMLDQGLYARDDTNRSETIVAPDVEDLQLSYVFPNSAAALQLVGATPGRLISAGDEKLDVAPAAGSPAYGDDPEAAARRTQHPGNIRAVRVSVIVRSAERDPDLVTAEGRTLPRAANRDVIDDAPAGYRRLLVETSASARNMDARAPFFPMYSESDADQMNRGGG
jgi:hypothetical protein